MYNNLIKSIKNKKCKVGIFGLGYVGLPLAIRFAEKKFQVFGYDNNKKKLEILNKGKSYIKQIDSKTIKNIINKKLKVFNEFNNVNKLDVLIFCLPTPIKSNKVPDLSYLRKCLKSIEKKIRPGQVFCNESTSYPGTTEEFFERTFNKAGLKTGKDVFLVFSPEREDPGNPIFKIKNITKIVSGQTAKCQNVGYEIYSKIVSNVFKASNIKTAEMTKLVENIFRSVNIGLINELKIICEKMGINIWEVVEAARSKPFGFYPFYPGPGVGGHCIPVDPFILTWKAKKYDVNTKFITLAGQINDQMPSYVVKRTINKLKRVNKNKKHFKILILGLAYKPDVDDYRESPSLKIMSILINKFRCSVDYSDPFISELPNNFGLNKKLKSIELGYEKIKKYDAAVIVTNHKKFDYKKIERFSRILVDTRGVFKKETDKIVLA